MKLFPNLEIKAEKENLKDNLVIIFGLGFFLLFFTLSWVNIMFKNLQLGILFLLLTMWSMGTINRVGSMHIDFFFLLNRTIEIVVEEIYLVTVGKDDKLISQEIQK